MTRTIYASSPVKREAKYFCALMKLEKKKGKRRGKVYHKINAIVFHKVVKFYLSRRFRRQLLTAGQTNGKGGFGATMALEENVYIV